MVSQALRNIFPRAHTPAGWPWSPTGPMPKLLGPSTLEDGNADWRFGSTCTIEAHASASAGRMTSKSPFHAPAPVVQWPLNTTGAQVRKNTEIIFQSVGEDQGALQAVILSDSQTQRPDSCCKAPILNLTVDCEPGMRALPTHPKEYHKKSGGTSLK